MTLTDLAWLRKLTLPDEPEFGARLHNIVQSIATQSQAVSDQGNFNPQGQPEPPPDIQGINVAAANGSHTVTITDQNSGVRRGVNYWLERDTSPNFPNPHPIDLGQSRHHTEYLGNGTYYWRGFSSYGSSPAGKPVYHGGAQPIAVNAGGSIGPPPSLPSQGSGTGAPGQGLVGPGPVLQRSDISGGPDWRGQGPGPGRIQTAMSGPGSPALSGSGASGGSSGGLVLSEAAISDCETLLNVAGTNTITAITQNPYASLAPNFLIRFVPANTNTSAVTIDINASGAVAITKNGTAPLAKDELLAGKEYIGIYDGTGFQIIGSIGPASALVLASDANGVPTAAVLASAKIWIGNGSNLPIALPFAGDVTLDNAGNTVTVKVNGAAVPASASVIGTNGSRQLIAQPNPAIVSLTLTPSTVALLPATPVKGQCASVNDALAPVLGAVVAGGGLAFAAVCYNGTQWTVFST